jgi:CHASE2 domain-containing sensor protein
MARRFIKGIAGLLLFRQLTRGLAYLRRPRIPRTRADNPAKGASADANPGHHSFRRRLAVSLLIGIVIELALIIGHKLELPLIVATEDAAMDFVMGQFRNVDRKGRQAFVLLEADQATFEVWDEPFYFHRDRVQRMIEFASGFEWVEGSGTAGEVARPELIVVDIDLSKEGRDDGSENLVQYLRRYSLAPNSPLILARTFRGWPVDESEDAIPRERESFLDPVVADSRNGSIFWASPHYQRDDDQHIRRWLLWQRTRKGADLSVLPSVQLLAQVLLGEQDEQSAAERHDILIQKLQTAPSCETSSAATDPTVEITTAEKAYTIDLCDTLTAQRLIYTMPYDVPMGELRPKVRGVPVLERVPAMDLAALDRNFLSGRVVVIGGTYRESRDWHVTPLGEMPGAMVVINAIHSLGANGPLRPPHPVLKVAIVVLLVLMMSLAFAKLHSFLGYLTASAAVLTLLVPASFLMFRSGVWLDFALPLLAVQIHEFAAEFEAIKSKRQKRKPKAGDESGAVDASTPTTSDNVAV